MSIDAHWAIPAPFRKSIPKASPWVVGHFSHARSPGLTTIVEFLKLWLSIDVHVYQVSPENKLASLQYINRTQHRELFTVTERHSHFDAVLYYTVCLFVCLYSSDFGSLVNAKRILYAALCTSRRARVYMCVRACVCECRQTPHRILFHGLLCRKTTTLLPMNERFLKQEKVRLFKLHISKSAFSTFTSVKLNL